MAGWIKIYRDITGHWIWDNPIYLKAWINILITVNHEDKKTLIEGELIECKRGQSLLSLNSWAKCFGKGWTMQRVRTFFELLKQDEMIATEGLRKTTRVTVCNYELYQNEQQANNKETTSREQAGNKEITTTKEGIRRNKKVIGDHTNDSFNFYAFEVAKAKEYPDDSMAVAYINLARHICKKDKDGNWDLPYVLKIEKQISLDDFSKLYVKANKNLEAITIKIDSIQNKVRYHNEYTNLYRTLNTWFNNDKK